MRPAQPITEDVVRRTLIAAFAVTGILFLAAWLAVPLPRDVRVAAIDLGWLAASLLAGIACVWARRLPENAHLHRSLGLAAAGSFVWALATVVWTYQELVQELEAPAFALADVGYWLSMPLFALALVLWPRERTQWDLAKVLDVTLVVGFAALFGIQFVLDPLLELEFSGLQIVYAFVYPPSEIFLFGAIVAALMFGGWHDRRRLELMAFGLLAYVVGYAGYTFLGDDYATGSLLDPLWVFGFAGVALAALAPAERQERSGWVGERGRLFAPAVTLILLAVVGMAVQLVHDTGVSVVELFALLALVVLLAARQAHAQLMLQTHVAEQRRLEQQLQHARKLDAVGRLAGGVAHDFNNLLTAIDGYTELALHGLSDGHPVRADLEEVRRATRRASELTRQLLVFSRRQTLAPQVVDLNTVVADAERLLRRLAGADVALELRLDPRPAYVLADPGQLEQVITNLVVNARDAMPDGGTVTLATRVSHDRVGLSVTDTGVGMSEEVKAQIFEPFFTTKSIGRGTGLGLAMVHGIVTQSGGEISVMSADGRGTTFFIAFPAVDAGAPALPAEGSAEGTTERAGSETVLLVEDEDAVRDLARRMLELAGYSVISASSGEEAARLFEELAGVDVLVTDVVMPGMSGDELARRLWSARPELRVVLMSGYSQDTEALDRLRAEGAAFVEKPFTSSTLVSEVRGVLDAVV